MPAFLQFSTDFSEIFTKILKKSARLNDAFKSELTPLDQMRQTISESWMNLGEIWFNLLAEVCKASLIPQNSDERSAWWNSNEIWAALWKIGWKFKCFVSLNEIFQMR